MFHPSAERLLERRIRGEYLEMPGLRLSLPQAARLWSVESGHCARLFDGLVTSGFLRRDRNGMFARTHRSH